MVKTIMKKILTLSFAALSLASCSSDHNGIITPSDMPEAKVYTAVIEPAFDAVRSTVDDQTGVFSWTDGDRIRVFDSTSHEDIDISVGDGTGTFVSELDSPLKAVYPYTIASAGDFTAVTLPSRYGDFKTEYVASTNAAMVADLTEEGNNTASFRHLGAVLQVKFINAPAGFNSLVFKADRPIVGEFEIVEGQISAAASASASDLNTVTYNFSDSPAGDLVFYVPVPAGTYRQFTIQLIDTDTGIEFWKQSSSSDRILERRDLGVLPTLDLSSQMTDTYKTIMAQGYYIRSTTYYVYSAAGLNAVLDDMDTNNRYSYNVSLQNNIDFGEGNTTNFTKVGNYSEYSGTFSGNNMTISNLYYSGSDNLGLLNKIGRNGVVKDLKIKNAQMETTGSNGSGFIASTNIGTIKNCHIENSSISGRSWTGAISSNANGTSSQGKVLGCSVTNCSISGTSVGGIVGQVSNSGVVAGCTVKISTITSMSDNRAGGIVGECGPGYVVGCYAYCNAVNSGSQYYKGGFVGHIESMQAHFTGCFVYGYNGFHGSSTNSCTFKGAFYQYDQDSNIVELDASLEWTYDWAGAMSEMNSALSFTANTNDHSCTWSGDSPATAAVVYNGD